MWLAILAASWIKPARNKLQRTRAANWPATDGRIETAEVMQPKASFFTPKSQPRPYTAEFHYSYSAVGGSYTGCYKRGFPTEGECREFVRDLSGKTITVQYNPDKPKKSDISMGAIQALLQTRTPRPENEPLVPFSPAVPAWLKPFVWVFVALSALGLTVSLWVHFGAAMGRRVAPEALFFTLHVGIFVVWAPAVHVAQGMVGNAKQKDFWKVVLRGSPAWVRYMVYGFFVYAFANFLLFMNQAPGNDTDSNMPITEWGGFSGTWMVFYSAALAILYSAARTDDMRLRCVNGHLASYQADYCAQCGQRIMPPSMKTPAPSPSA